MDQERARKGEMEMSPTRVLLADDHTMFREGLAGLLASYGGLEVVAEVPNDEQAVELARRHRPDVVIMQVQMPFERSTESLEQDTPDNAPQPKGGHRHHVRRPPRHARAAKDGG